jgi:hypothetical protein
LRKVLHHLLEHAIAIKMIAHNPVISVGRFKNASSGLHCWTDDEIKQYRAYWAIGTQQRLAMELALETTSRRTDVTRIGPQHERNGKLDLRHTKNNSEALIPITPVLRAAIDGCPTKHLTFLHTRAGAPCSPKALGGAFRKWCDAAGLPKRCTIHKLRKSGARRLAEAGATARDHVDHRPQDFERSAALYGCRRARASRRTGDREVERAHENKTARGIVQPTDPVGQNGT